jgi:hypothetical protein
MKLFFHDGNKQVGADRDPDQCFDNSEKGSNRNVCGCRAGGGMCGKLRNRIKTFLNLQLPTLMSSNVVSPLPLRALRVGRLATKNTRSHKNGNGSTRGRALLWGVLWGGLARLRPVTFIDRDRALPYLEILTSNP